MTNNDNNDKYRNFCFISSNLSVACQAGLYKAADMKTCQTCTDGKEPNSDKTACGKTTP